MADVPPGTEAGNGNLPCFTVKEVQKHNNEKDAWIINNGRVYDVTSFLDRHPGGKDILWKNCGEDVTELMKDYAHSENAYGLLSKFFIGTLEKTKDSFNDPTYKDVPYMHGYMEELVNWKEPMIVQVGSLGSHYRKWVHSPVDHQLRLFKSDFVEIFSKTPWFFVPILWIPVVLYTSYLALLDLTTEGLAHWTEFPVHSSLFTVLGLYASLFIFGLFAWTLVEYVLHRFLFHIPFPDDSPFWITFHFFLHGQHHKVPFDGYRLVFPPVAASVFALFFYTWFTSVMPGAVARSIFSGGLLGYIIYDCTHYYLHHGSPKPGSYFHQLKQYHISHHFHHQDKGYGISSVLWDIPFGTFPSKID